MGCSSGKDAQDASAKGGSKCGDHLQKPEDLTGFPTFPAGLDKSQVAICCTPDIWAKYKDSKDKCGFTFKQAIFSGAKHPDSGIGAYAGSEDSYPAFKDFFDKLIQNYHGHGPDGKHVSDMNAEALDCPPFPEDEAAMIKSTRIRVGRNLADFPLGPLVTKEQRVEIMNKVVEACTKFDGDLQGKFYPLEGMDNATQEQLIADHFLFK